MTDKPERMPDLLERVQYAINGNVHTHWVATWYNVEGKDYYVNGFTPVVEHFFHYRQQIDGSWRLVGLN